MLSIILAACSSSNDWNNLLDKRNAAINHQDLQAYAALIAPDYQSQQESREQLLKRLDGLFKQFSNIKMQSIDRHCQKIDDTHAECAQAYHVNIRSQQQERSLTGREQLQLQRYDGIWLIKSGL